MTKKLDGQKTMQSKIDNMFYLVKDENNKVNICVAGYAVSQKKFDTFKQADEYIGTKPWEIIVNVQYVLSKKTQENEINKKDTKDA